MTIGINQIIRGSCLNILSQMDTEYIDLTVTSPPYDNLRDYKGYKFDHEYFKLMAKELYRVTKKGGVVVWVVGDATVNGSETGTSFKQVLYFKECGFNLHDTMFYFKPGVVFPDKYRYFQQIEYMFVLSKGFPKTVHLIKDQKTKHFKRSLKTERQKDGSMKKKKPKVNETRLSIRGNIWRIDTGYMKTTKDKYAYSHPAMFPEKLALDHIISWSKKGDLVLDPFSGSGTTCKMAKIMDRKYIGIDISEEYCKLAKERLENTPEPLIVEGD